MTQPRKSGTNSKEQRLAAESEAAKQADDRRHQPAAIAQRALMQRQAKKLHQRDGK